MDTCFHKNCEITFDTNSKNHTFTTRKHKRASKHFGRPPFTIDDVFVRGGVFTLYIVLPNGIEMTPCHISEHALVRTANNTYTILAKLYSGKDGKKGGINMFTLHNSCSGRIYEAYI